MKSLDTRLFGVILCLFVIIGCKTNKEPNWVTNPPPDNENYIFIVTFSSDSNYVKNLVDQLEKKHGYNQDFLYDIFLGIFLEEEYNEVQILETWESESGLYNLIRIDRSFFSRIASKSLDSLPTMPEMEILGDNELMEFNGYRAYLAYLDALRELMKSPSLETVPDIIRIIDKIFIILDGFELTKINIFDKVAIDEIFYIKELESPVKSFNFTLEGTDISYNDFLFIVNFIQGYKNDRGSATIPIRNNRLEFVPPRPKIVGEAYIESYIDLFFLKEILEMGTEYYFLKVATDKALARLEKIVANTRVYFNYECVGEY